MHDFGESMDDVAMKTNLLAGITPRDVGRALNLLYSGHDKKRILMTVM